MTFDLPSSRSVTRGRRARARTTGTGNPRVRARAMQRTCARAALLIRPSKRAVLLTAHQSSFALHKARGEAICFRVVA
jgi:hypothetical protein